MGAEKKLTELRRDEKSKVNVLWHWLLPLLLFVSVAAIFTTLHFLISDFLGWASIVLSLLFWVLLLALISIFVYYMRFKSFVEISERLQYLKPDEATQYIVDSFKRDDNNPVNLVLYQGLRKYSLTLSVGSGSDRTEVYVRKFVDSNPLNHDFYYCFMRVNQPDTLSYFAVKDEPSIEEEKSYIEDYSEKLALTPSMMREVKIERTSPLTGLTEISTTREPIEVLATKSRLESGKEDIEGD